MIHQVFHCLWVDKGFTATEIQLFCSLPKTEEMFWWKGKGEYWILGWGDDMNELQSGLNFGPSIRKVLLSNGISFFTLSPTISGDWHYWGHLPKAQGPWKIFWRRKKSTWEWPRTFCEDLWDPHHSALTLQPSQWVSLAAAPLRVCGGYENSL